MKSRLSTINDLLKEFNHAVKKKALCPTKELQGKLILLKVRLQKLERKYSSPLMEDSRLEISQDILRQKYELSNEINQLSNIISRESARKSLINHIFFWTWFWGLD